MSETTALTQQTPEEWLLFPKDERMIVGGTGAAGSTIAAPDFMEEDANTGMTELRKYVRPSRIKVVQDKRTDAYKQYKPGSVVLTPQGIVVAEIGQPFWLVPIFFYSEYCTINDYRLKDQKPMIRERTLDPNSIIARKSRSNDTRFEKDPDFGPDKDFKMRHTEFLVFLSIIVRTPGLAATPVALSFSRGEYGAGQNFASLIDARRPRPIFGCVFQGTVSETPRKNAQGDWYGIDITNPTSKDGPQSPWVMDPAEYNSLKALHFQLKEAYDSQLIIVDHDTDEGGGDPQVSGGDESKFS